MLSRNTGSVAAVACCCTATSTKQQQQLLLLLLPPQLPAMPVPVPTQARQLAQQRRCICSSSLASNIPQHHCTKAPQQLGSPMQERQLASCSLQQSLVHLPAIPFNTNGVPDPAAAAAEAIVDRRLQQTQQPHYAGSLLLS
eukprot:GHRQ01001604.1.p2 GENE.GHRQ01001604.1~~GHRQ01001604.1.p2  ORF type:complete len:153 (-),score=50.09 GHRQ01001604.1:813-1235(-)